MSGTSTEAGDFTPATTPQMLANEVLILAVQPSDGDVPSLGFTATLQQILDYVGENIALVNGSGVTESDSALALPGLPALPNTRCVCRLTGQITAQIIETGDASSWDIALILKRVGADIEPTFVGTSSGATVFAQDIALAGCTVTSGIVANGPGIIVTGIASTPIEWAYTLTTVISD